MRLERAPERRTGVASLVVENVGPAVATSIQLVGLDKLKMRVIDKSIEAIARLEPREERRSSVSIHWSTPLTAAIEVTWVDDSGQRERTFELSRP